MRHTKSLLAAAIGVLLSAAAGIAEDYPKITLRFGHMVPNTASHTLTDAWFAEQLSKRTNGRVKQEIYWAGAIGSANELLDLVSEGAVDISAVPASYFPAVVPLLAAPNSLPMVLKSPEEALKVVQRLWEKVPAVRQEAKAKNVYPLMFHPLNDYHMLCTKPVRTVEDLKGLKIRSFGEYVPMAIAAVGAVPVTVLPPEMYENLQRGNIDCVPLSYSLFIANRLEEVAKYASTISLGAFVSNPVWYNLDRYNALPENVRKLLGELAVEANQWELEYLRTSEQNAIEKLKAAGVKIIEFQDQKKFEALLPDFLEVWRKRREAAGQGEAAAQVVRVWREQ